MAKRQQFNHCLIMFSVKPLQAEEKLPSGIILPDSAKEKPQDWAVGGRITELLRRFRRQGG